MGTDFSSTKLKNDKILCLDRYLPDCFWMCQWLYWDYIYIYIKKKTCKTTHQIKSPTTQKPNSQLILGGKKTTSRYWSGVSPKIPVCSCGLMQAKLVRTKQFSLGGEVFQCIQSVIVFNFSIRWSSNESCEYVEPHPNLAVQMKHCFVNLVNKTKIYLISASQAGVSLLFC